MSFFSSTWINGASMPQVVLRAGDIPPPLDERYFTQLDGQSKFFRREAAWACVDPVVEITFLGNTVPTTYFLFDGVDATDRAFLYANANNGLLNTNAATIELNSAVVSNAAVAAVVGKLNKVIVTFSGSYRLQTLGARFSQDSLFAPTIISSIKLIDPADTANTFNYPMGKNLPYELPDGNATGPELFDFLNMGTAADNTVTQINGGFIFSGAPNTGQNGERCYLNVVTEVGKSYAVSLELLGQQVTGSIFSRAAPNGAGAVLATSGFGDGFFSFTATSTASSILFDGNTTVENYSFDVSVRELPSSAFIFENGSIDGSDRLLVTEKQDGSGFVGETGIEYDYATGAAPVDSYGTEYSTAYS
tara:strand:+ start:17199 stop:18284 length:1086 start_codon:yes stop_codon:yes gene_type:complete